MLGFNLIEAQFEWTEYVMLENLGFGKRCPFIFQSPTKKSFGKSQVWGKLSHSKSPKPATLTIFEHKWEARSQKVSANAFNFNPTPWNVWPVMVQAVRKSFFSTSIPRRKIPDFQTPLALLSGFSSRLKQCAFLITSSTSHSHEFLTSIDLER